MSDDLTAALDRIEGLAEKATRGSWGVTEFDLFAARTDLPAIAAVVRAVLDLTGDVGNESTGPTYVACHEVRTAITKAWEETR